jgi:hypothetical protein
VTTAVAARLRQDALQPRGEPLGARGKGEAIEQEAERDTNVDVVDFGWSSMPTICRQEMTSSSANAAAGRPGR